MLAQVAADEGRGRGRVIAMRYLLIIVNLHRVILVINDFGQMGSPNTNNTAVLDKCVRVCLCRQGLIEEIH